MALPSSSFLQNEPHEIPVLPLVKPPFSYPPVILLPLTLKPPRNPLKVD